MHRHRRPGRDVQRVRDPQRGHALDRGERAGAELERAQVARDEAHGGGGDHEHDGDEQRADRRQRHDHGARDGGEQQPLGAA